MRSAESGARALAGVVLAVSLGLLAGGPPLLRALAPPVCSFKARTGLPCVGCGGTHALALAARGDVAGALRSNPLGAWAGACLWGVAAAALASLATGSRRYVLRALAAGAALSVVALLAGSIAWWSASFTAVF
jgi:hypothetical protein